MKRWIPAVALGLVLTACSGTDEPNADSPPAPSTTSSEGDPEPSTGQPTGESSGEPSAAVPHPVSLPALAQKDFNFTQSMHGPLVGIRLYF